MKRVYAYVVPLYGPRFRFGHEVKGIINLLEYEFHGGDVAEINVSTPTQLLAVDLWCQKQGYELNVFNDDGEQFETVMDAHHYVNEEYVFLDSDELENFSIDNNE